MLLTLIVTKQDSQEKLFNTVKAARPILMSFLVGTGQKAAVMFFATER